IAGLSAEARIAFAAVIDKGDRHAGLAAADARVGDAVRRRPEVGMRAARAPDEVDVGVRLRIDRRRRNVLVPPVVRWKKLAAAEVVGELDAGVGSRAGIRESGFGSRR